MTFSNLFIYKFIFITELIVAESMFVATVKRRKNFKLRTVCCVLACYLFAFVYPIIDGVSYTWWASSIMFLALFCATLGSLFVCFDAPPLKLIFCAVAGYTVQHLSYEIFDFVNRCIFNSAADMYGSNVFSFSDITPTTILLAVIYFNIYLLVYANSSFIMSKRIKNSDDLKFNNLSLIFFVIFVLLIDVVLNAVVQYIDDMHNYSYDVLLCVYNIISCITVFYIQMTMIKTRDIENEMKVLSELFGQYQRHYALFKENNELFNQKYHDLRHQLSALAKKHDLSEDYTEELKNIVSVYDSKIETGNETLDIILTEKSLICGNSDIVFTCMADGKLISFMSDGDLYALFGNVLENAIEAVLKVADEQKRCINFRIYQKSNFVVIYTDNYFVGKIEKTKEGLIKTTKESGDYHGYGMRSMNTIVEKYGGDVSIAIVDDKFKLSIILPLR